jgi:putative addiction module CopG family antidote
MTIRLSAELQSYIDEQVGRGKYESTDAAIAEAVRRMKERDEKLEWLRREAQLGLDDLDAGRAEPWDVEEMKAKLREKYRKA